MGVQSRLAPPGTINRLDLTDDGYVYRTDSTTTLHPVTGATLPQPAPVSGVGSSSVGSQPSPSTPSSTTTRTGVFEVRDPVDPLPQTINVEVVEGINTEGGDLELFSTGEVFPTEIESEGWANENGAKSLGGGNASITTTSGGYSGTISGKLFAADIPDGAVIKGIKVRVYRSFING